jgi:hypothetical protein
MTKEFIQLKLSPGDDLDFNNDYSKNLIPDNTLVMGIGIYALPGTVF